jgi:inhibitor of KinA sporulation pathway (predicted exonuclease)
MLPIELERYHLKKYHCYSKYLNLKDEFEKCFGQKAGSMPNMLKKLKIELTGKHHSGIDDCKNLAKVVIEMIKRGYQFVC